MARRSASTVASRAQLLGLLGQALAPSQPIDRPISRRRRDPRSRVVGNAALGPGLESRDERILDRFLGKVEVAEDADQRRDRPPLFLAEHAVDDVVRDLDRRQGLPRGIAQCAWPAAAVSASGADADQSKIGRTSIAPSRAPGIIAAKAIASSRSAAWTR